MAKYRKKPVEIEALQYSERNLREIVDFVGENNLELLENVECTGFIPYIKTLEGKMMVSEGDYVIKGVKGEFYPCKPDIFEQTYEASTVIEQTTIKLWIARDKNGYLKGYDEMPQKKEEYGFFFMKMWYDLDNRLFPEVTWENSPVKVELKIKI